MKIRLGTFQYNVSIISRFNLAKFIFILLIYLLSSFLWVVPSSSYFPLVVENQPSSFNSSHNFLSPSFSHSVMESEPTPKQDNYNYTHSISFVVRSTHLEDLIVHGSSGANVTIAVLSSGLSNYSLFYDQTLANLDFVYNASGGVDYDGVGTMLIELLLNKQYGLCPNASVINIRITENGVPNYFELSTAIYAALDYDPDIILLGFDSLGSETGNFSQAIYDAVAAGSLVISPSGDYGPAYSSLIGGSLSYHVLSVGGVKHHAGTLAYAYDYENYFVPSFMSRGPSPSYFYAPQIVAPCSVYLENYSFISQNANEGLPFSHIDNAESSIVSAAIVVGGVANIISSLKRDGITSVPGDLIRAALIETAIPLEDSWDPNSCGNGLVNFYDAYRLIKRVLLQNASFATIFPRTPLALPFVYYNETRKSYYGFIYQRVPVNIFVYAYAPSSEHSTLFLPLTFVEQNYSHIYFRANITNLSTFSGVIQLNQSFILSPYYLPTINVSVRIESILISCKLDVKFPSATVAFDDLHDTDGYYFGDSLTGDYWTLASNFALNNIAIYSLSTSPFDLDHYDLLILPDPEVAFTSSERLAYKSYLTNGGNILFIAGDSEFQAFTNVSSELSFFEKSATNQENINIFGREFHFILPPGWTENVASPPFNNPIVSDIYWFLNRYYIEYTYLNSSGYWGNVPTPIKKVVYSGYNLVPDPNDTNLEVIIARDWMHYRGVLLAKTRVGTGNLLISSTESFWTTYGYYFNQLILEDKAYDYYHFFFLLLNIIGDRQISVEAEHNRLPMLWSRFSVELTTSINSDALQLENYTATMLIPELNVTVKGNLSDDSSALKFSFILPYFYTGSLVIYIYLKFHGYHSVLLVFTTDIELMPAMYGAIIGFGVLILILLVLLSLQLRPKFKSFSAKRLFSKYYCENCRLPIGNKQTSCPYCSNTVKKRPEK